QSALYSLLPKGADSPSSCYTVNTDEVTGNGTFPFKFRRASLPYNQCPSDESLQSITSNPTEPRGSYYSSLGPTYIYPDKCGSPPLPYASYYDRAISPSLPYFATYPDYLNGYVDNLGKAPGM